MARMVRCHCGAVEYRHCSFDEPGVDHPQDCSLKHHEFKVARTEKQGGAEA